MFVRALRFFVFALLLGSVNFLSAQEPNTTLPQWPVSGNTLSESRWQTAETQINSSNAYRLAVKWTFTTGGDVSATPTVSGDTVFFPDWAGNLYAVNKNSGVLIWSHKISAYTGISGDVTRVSPAAYNGAIIVGDHLNGSHNGALVLAVSQQTGELLWKTQVDTHPAAIITGSPVVANGVVYIGISSSEEGMATLTGYACCSFRGSVVALEASTGKILWKTYDMPSNGGKPGGYSGGAIWSAPAVDLTRGLVYATTGNNYTVPSSATTCQKQNPKSSTCTAANDYFDSVIALEITTGAVKWGRKLSTYDAWTIACESGKTGYCPSPHGSDYDFGGGPNLFSGLVGAGQKSGIYWALNADTGAIVWTSVAGPGGGGGGVVWGTANDSMHVYVENGNSSNISETLSSGKTINWGSWTALRTTSGQKVWQTADPVAGSHDPGAMSVANGVVYAGSIEGHMYAMSAATGKILWKFQSGGSVIDAPSIVDGVVYWGSGYSRSGKGNNKVYAFYIP